MSSRKSSLRRHRRGSSRRLARSLEPSYGPGGLDAGLGPAIPVDRKLAQLCEQASEALSYALASSADWVLRDLLIASVTPAPDASRLLVTVYPPHDTPSESPETSDAIDAAALVARLENARSYLRSEVASAIHRKRTPDLAFRVATSPPSRG